MRIPHAKLDEADVIVVVRTDGVFIDKCRDTWVYEIFNGKGEPELSAEKAAEHRAARETERPQDKSTHTIDERLLRSLASDQSAGAADETGQSAGEHFKDF